MGSSSVSRRQGCYDNIQQLRKMSPSTNKERQTVTMWGRRKAEKSNGPVCCATVKHHKWTFCCFVFPSGYDDNGSYMTAEVDGTKTEGLNKSQITPQAQREGAESKPSMDLGNGFPRGYSHEGKLVIGFCSLACACEACICLSPCLCVQHLSQTQS